MRSIIYIPVLALFIASCSNNAPSASQSQDEDKIAATDTLQPSELNDLQLKHLNGDIKTVYTISNNTARYTDDNQYIIKDTSNEVTMDSFDRNGRMVLREKRYVKKGVTTLISRYVFSDKVNNVATYKTYTGDKYWGFYTQSFTDPFTLTTKIFKVSKDTSLSSETIVHFIKNIDNSRTEDRDYSETATPKTLVHETTSTNKADTTYFVRTEGKDTSKVKVIFIEKDKKGNPLKTVVNNYSGEISIILNSYDYYPPAQ